jgi:DNA-binding phage protein
MLPMTDIREFDPAWHPDNPTVIAAYLTEAFATGDDAFIAHAIETVARARARLNIGDEFDGPHRENPDVPLGARRSFATDAHGLV